MNFQKLIKKKINVIFSICILTFFSSCSKKDVALQNPSYGNKILNKIEAIKRNDIRQLAYTNFSDQERYELWVAKLENELNKTSYSNDQKNRIKELKEHLNVDIFKDGDARQIFVTLWIAEWVAKSKQVFTSVQIHNIAFTINNIVISTNRNLTSGGDESPGSACICALNSSFTCPSYTVTYPPSVSYKECKKIGDCVESRGCGALWDQECDGNKC